MNILKNSAFAVLLILVATASVAYFFLGQHKYADHQDYHPIADPYDDKYHVHADFHIVVRDTLVNLDDDVFQTTSSQGLHPDLHLHDNNGDVEHIHAEDKTFVEFLESLKITLTDSCITLDNEYCSSDSEEVLLFVNNERHTQAVVEYIPADNDQILVYYGVFNMKTIQPYLDAVPDDACYYSGTCLERGVAPPESCGLTCEL